MGLPNWITDYPTAWMGLIGAVLALGAAFGLHVTPDQTQAILGFFAALFVIFALVGHATTVPKTPSSEAPASAIQVPAPANPPPTPPNH